MGGYLYVRSLFYRLGGFGTCFVADAFRLAGMVCPKIGKRLVVPFLFEWETLKLVSPDVCELLHVGQHLNVSVCRIFYARRDGAGCHHLVGFHIAY